ncbi:hypothetical protein AB6A40_007317 [Gnathostoma spinigerum]|uniref:Trehalase n=1 Tax=Gnathostoma spinigerum TaxID=75299 RepID=A0ABD6EU88_9BILA
MVMAFVVGIILFHVFIAHGLHVGVYETDNEDSDIFQPATHLKVISSFDSPNCSEPVCTGPLSNIYCSGKILHASWLFGLQRSCPGDMMRNSPAFILKEFSKLKYPLKRDEFKAFCFENFASVPYLKYAELDDWSESPPNVVLLKDTKFWKFVNELNQIWKNLGREFIPKVHELPHLFPIVPVLNRFVVPGGFFQIYFYWDSYWIMKGLLFSNMKSTVLGMLENFASIIDRHGFIPNSGAIQLSRRSQPPLFTQMVADYISVVENKTTLSRMVTYVERELMWWQLNRNVSVKSASGETYLMYQYRV